MKYAVKIIAAMITAAVMVASAAVCVSAESVLFDRSIYKYIAQDNYGNIFISQKPMYFSMFRTYVNNTQSDRCYGIASGSPFLVLIPYTVDDTVNYTIITCNVPHRKYYYYVSDFIEYTDDLNKFNQYSLNNSSWSNKTNNSNYLYCFLYYSSSVYIQSLKYTTNDNTNGLTTSSSLTTVTVDTDLYDTIFGSSDWDIIISAIDNQTNIIMTTGSGNPLPSGGSDLGQAQNNLISAEDALSNKSDSLVSSVSNQWTTYKSTTQTFVTDIKPSATAVSTIYTNFVDSLPDEIKALLISIPILIFLGWLIGRVRG